jgi:hypothetical protein
MMTDFRVDPMTTARSARVQAGTRLALLLVLLATACVDRGPDPGRDFQVLHDGRLGSGLDLGVDSSPRRQGWVRFDTDRGQMDVDHAANTSWGAVTFLLGLDDPAHRLTDDFSAFNVLEVVASGQWGRPRAQTCGWSGSGVGFTIIGLADSPVPTDSCNPAAPPLDAHGQECWLPPPPAGASRTYWIPLAYLEQGRPLRSRLWSPAQILLPDTVGGTGYSFSVQRISLVPADPAAPLGPPDELCPADCLCLTPACELTCGRRDLP